MNKPFEVEYTSNNSAEIVDQVGFVLCQVINEDGTILEGDDLRITYLLDILNSDKAETLERATQFAAEARKEF